MGNDVFDAVRTMLAVREYQDRAVPDEVVRRVLEAGRASASAQNRQPWHFVVVRERDRLGRLGELVRTGPYIASAAFAVVACHERESRFGVSDTSRAIQSMMLTAWAEGVGSNWTSSGTMDAVARELEVPEGYVVFAVIPFGYPARRVGLGKKNRKLLPEVASAERFGQPFS